MAVPATPRQPAASFTPMAVPRRWGPTRSIVITTVVDQVRPWLMPSRTFAATTRPPGRGQDQQNRDRQGEHPSCDQYGLAPVAVAEGAGEVVRAGFGQAEGEDVCHRPGVVVQPELLSGQQRQHGPLLPEGRPDQGVDCHEQQELGKVLPQPPSERSNDGAMGHP